MSIKPIGERVLLKPIEQEEKTASGIIIPDNAKEKPQEAEVVAVADDVKSVKVGDKALYGKYAGTEVTHKGTKYLIMKEDEILAVL